jgi:CDP-4-dehydro-6-deoxyglucose reductase
MLIRLESSGRCFEAEPNEPVLDAAERAGIELPYSCRDGICGTCKARLTSGTVEHGMYADISEHERAQGYFLMCCSSATSDIVIDAPSDESGFTPPPLRAECEVGDIAYPTPDVAILRLKLPAGSNLRFRAGQYVEVILEDGARRSFSIANAPHEQGAIELHVRHVPGGMFTTQVFKQLKQGDTLTIEGPRGGFYLRDENRPVVLVASGTGFAPIKSMMLDGIRRKLAGPAFLYWGGRRKQDLYMLDLAESWVKRTSSFSFRPVLSAPEATDAWAGRTGLVHEAVLADFPDLSAYDVYACGVPAMVEAAKRDFAKAHLPADRFFADLFLTTSDRLAAR